MSHYHIKSVKWGEDTQYNAGQLTINRQYLLNYLKSKKEFSDIELTDIDLISPNTSTRVVNIFDVFAARAKVGEHESDYPGVLGGMKPAGEGETAVLDDFTVLVLSSKQDKDNKILDMSGPAVEVTPYANMCHLAIKAQPKNDDLPTGEYYGALKQLGLFAGCYLAYAASKQVTNLASVYHTGSLNEELPKAVYICMIASHQKSEPGEPILYGDDVSGLLPTILHPNEMLDGAVIAPYWNLGIDTYSFQNNPVVLNLYEKHGVEVNFSGVVVYVANITREKRARSVTMIQNLVSSVLGADIAIVSKLGGGIPESDLMMTIEALEEKEIDTSAVIWSSYNDGTIEDSLSANSTAADALASVGCYDIKLDIDPQNKVVGGDTVGPFSGDPNEDPLPAGSALQVHYRTISGAISQLGASKVAMSEI
nr:glycine/sarcosine/betaine reductase component B subunit [Salibacterium salarium]